MDIDKKEIEQIKSLVESLNKYSLKFLKDYATMELQRREDLQKAAEHKDQIKLTK